MPVSLLDLLGVTDAGAAALLIFAGLLGGLVRGFTGFGFAMVFMPLAAVAIGPAKAAALIWVLDAPFSLPLAARSVRRADWGEVLPLLLAASLMLPVGVWILLRSDPLVLRWVIAALILGAVLLLVSGWRYAGRAGLALSLPVGAASGLFSGMAQIGGMPIAIFWLGAQRADARRIRDNLLCFFAASTFVSGTVFWWNGLLDAKAFLASAPLLPVYGAGLWIGARYFDRAAEATFRRIAYGVIAASAVLALPVFEGWLR